MLLRPLMKNACPSQFLPCLIERYRLDRSVSRQRCASRAGPEERGMAINGLNSRIFSIRRDLPKGLQDVHHLLARPPSCVECKVAGAGTAPRHRGSGRDTRRNHYEEIEGASAKHSLSPGTGTLAIVRICDDCRCPVEGCEPGKFRGRGAVSIWTWHRPGDRSAFQVGLSWCAGTGRADHISSLTAKPVSCHSPENGLKTSAFRN